jgi:hypothetical protein
MKMLLLQWADWISRTWLSQLLSNHQWVIPTSQSIHILGVSVVFSCAVMISLRLLGVGQGRSLSRLTRTLAPWMYWSLGVLLLTGTGQTIAEPVRQFVTPAFWSKMLMIICVLLLTLWFTRAVARCAPLWDSPATLPIAAKLWGVMSLGLWVAIIFCGRFIGYTWESHL